MSWYPHRATSLKDQVSHRRLILLQRLQVAAHVKQMTDFSVRWSSTSERSAGIHELWPHSEMRRITFPLRDRAVLIPAELKHVSRYRDNSYLLLLWRCGTSSHGACCRTHRHRSFPLMLPHLPTADFTSKGMILGVVAAGPFALYLCYLQWTGWE